MLLRHAQNALARLPLLWAALLFLLPAAALAQDATPAATPEPPAPIPVTAPRQVDYEPGFDEIDCPFGVSWTEALICGLLSVPENRLNPEYDPQDDTIRIFVAILKSRGRPVADPVLVLAGGPGAAASAMRAQFLPLDLRQNRDVFLMDARGTGYSTPSLNCPEVGTGSESASVVEAYAACQERLLDDGRDLSGYVSDEMVEDVADLAEVLGVGSLNLYGTSYGARLAVRVSERYPSLVRSMLLDGAVPLSANMLLEEPLNIYGAFRRIAQDCVDDRQCNGTYPALEARLLEVIDRYNRAPLPESVGYGSGDDILRFLLDELRNGGRAIPAFVTALYDEDFPRACAALPAADGCRFDEGSDGESAAPSPEPEVSSWRDLFVSPTDPAGPDAGRIGWLMADLEYDTPQELFAYLDTLSLARAQRLVELIPGEEIDPLSEGVYASLLCSEEAPFYAAADVAEVARRIPAQFGALPTQRAYDVAALCGAWQMPALSPAARVTQMSVTPTLITAGTHNPLLPPAWARLTAAYLERSTILFFPGYGDAILAGGDACMGELMADFYAGPDDPLTAPCRETLALRFYFADDEEPLP